MNVADWIILGIIAVSTLISLYRGFAREAMSMITWIAALVVAMVFYARLADALVPYLSAPGLRLIAAFALLFIGTLVIGAILGFLVGLLVDMTGLTLMDRALGTVFGLVRGGILVLSLLIIMQPALKPDQYGWWQESRLIPHFLVMERWGRQTAHEVAAVFHRAVKKS